MSDVTACLGFAASYPVPPHALGFRRAVAAALAAGALPPWEAHPERGAAAADAAVAAAAAAAGRPLVLHGPGPE
jgi:hypothetical protein